ncbi:MAG: M23 family metallopeptidase [Microbacteriaceae bacterium]
MATSTASLSAAKSHFELISREYRAMKDSYDHAAALAREASSRATEAVVVATASARQLLLGLRSEGNRPGTNSTLEVLLNRGGGDLMQRLAAVDRLGKLSASPAKIAIRAARDAEQASALKTKAAKAKGVVAAIALADKLTEMNAAKAELVAAQQALDAAQNRLTTFSGGGAVALYPAADLPTAGSWVDPTRGPITDGFGTRPSRPAGTAAFHPGVDIGAACLSPIVAAAGGVVVAAGPNSGYGNWILIDHGDGIQTGYGHIVDGGIAVTVGDHVAAGQFIARVGSTGASTGCHLHLEVRIGGQQIDPQPFFAARGVAVGR